MPLLERLVLFDIDGTLLSAGGAPRRAFRRALVEYFGTNGEEENTDFSGKTDPQIVYELMRTAGFDDVDIEERMADLFDHYLDGLAGELEVETRHRLFPGVERLVPELAADPRVVLGLLTGNVERGARLKLEHFGLWGCFALGAFGSDDPDRNRLARIAVDRAEHQTGRKFSGSEVVVIGDTPADVLCARAIDAVAIAVATGRPSRAELEACHPDILLDSLGDWSELLVALGLAKKPPAGASVGSPSTP